MQEIIPISPENLEVANSYVKLGTIDLVSKDLRLPPDKVAEIISSKEIRRYLDAVYLDLGYRNRTQIASVLDEIIEQKLEEARESEVYTKKDLVDLLQIAHKMRMDEIAAINKREEKAPQINISNDSSPFGDSNYGKLMQTLMGQA